MESKPRRTLGRGDRLALAAQVGVLVFLACLLVLHALTLRSLPWYMSEYANSPYKAVFLGGGYAFILGLVSLVLGLSRRLPHTRRIHAALVLLALVVPFAFLATTFPVDPGDRSATWSGRVHDWSTIPLFLFLNAALLVLAPGLQLGKDKRLARATLAAGIVAAAAEVAYLVARLVEVPWVALAQRLLVGTAIAWCLLVASSLRVGSLRASESVPSVEASSTAPDGQDGPATTGLSASSRDD